MFVCVCAAVTTDQINESIQKGNDSLELLQKDLKVACNCNCCVFDIQEILLLEKIKNIK